MSKKSIKKLAELRGDMSIRAFAKLIGESPQRISAMELHGQSVNSDMLYKYWRVWHARKMGSAEEFLDVFRPAGWKDL